MGPAPALIASTIAADAQAAAKYIDDQTSDAAYVLAALTTHHDASLHHIVLDLGSRTVWWAYNNEPLERDGWTVDHLSPETAAKRASDQVEAILDRQDHPEWYAAGHGDLDQDQAVLDEYAGILRLLVSADPAAAAEVIRARRKGLARQDALWQRTYVEMVGSLAGSERGGKTHAGRVIGRSDVQVGRILREAASRRQALEDAVSHARAGGDAAGTAPARRKDRGAAVPMTLLLDEPSN